MSAPAPPLTETLQCAHYSCPFSVRGGTAWRWLGSSVIPEPTSSNVLARSLSLSGLSLLLVTRIVLVSLLILLRLQATTRIGH